MGSAASVSDIPATEEEALQRYSAEQIAEFVGGLLPPPPEVQLWLDRKYDSGDPDKVEAQLKAALPWLKVALAKAFTDAELKAKAKELLAVSQFTTNLGWAGVFDELQAHCRKTAVAYGAEMKAYYEREGLAASLGRLEMPALRDEEQEGAPPVEVRRQDHPSRVAFPFPPRRDDDGDLEWDKVSTHALRLAALGLDPFFQRICRRVTEAHGGEFKSTAIKGHARMMTKCTSAEDHRYEAQPRPACNIDINRNACTFERAEDLERAAKALCSEFGGAPARVKNMFAFDEQRAEAQMHCTFFILRSCVEV